MKLSEEDVQLFYDLHLPLLIYTNEQMDFFDEVKTPEAFMPLPPENKLKIRDALYDHVDLFDSFARENPSGLSKEQLEIVQSWKDFVKGSFYLFRYLKSHAIFLDQEAPPKAYGVLALTDGFDEMLGTNLPILLDTVLLPFKGRIIYDGLMAPYPISFGGGVRRQLNNSYQNAKATFGIITSLPFSEEMGQSDADKLKFYLRTKRNREMYADEIWELTHTSDSLLALYHQEMGKVHARSYKKQLRDIGVADAWFAVLEGCIIASGKTKPEVQRNLRKILPAGKEELVHIFRVKK